jgi:phage gp46-like protein
MCAVTSSITMNAVEVSVEVVNSGVLIVHIQQATGRGDTHQKMILGHNCINL